MRNDPKTTQGYGSALGAMLQPQTATEIPQKESGLVNAVGRLDGAVMQLSEVLKHLDARTKPVRVQEKPTECGKDCAEPTPTDCEAASRIRDITFRLHCSIGHANQLIRELDC